MRESKDADNRALFLDGVLRAKVTDTERLEEPDRDRHTVTER